MSEYWRVDRILTIASHHFMDITWNIFGQPTVKRTLDKSLLITYYHLLFVKSVLFLNF